MNNWALGFIVYVVIVALAVCRMYSVGKDKPPRHKAEDEWQAQEIKRLYLQKIKKQGGASEFAQTIGVLIFAGISIWVVDHWVFVKEFVGQLIIQYLTFKF